MTAVSKAPRVLPVRPVTLGVLAVPTVLLGYLSGFPDGGGIVLAVAAVVLATGLRADESHRASSYAPLPVLFVLVLEAVTAPIGFGTELLAGLAGLAFLVWLADDPARPAGGAVRGIPEIALPALALGIAWSSELFLPSGVIPLGVAGALLALTLAAVAFLVGWPTVLDREEARS